MPNSIEANGLSECPDPYGEIQFVISLPPISQHANGKTKANFKEGVRNITRKSKYLLSGDVRLEVEWFLQEHVRYESDRSPDLDNILKPLIDALCGPDGLIVDDNQIQRISCAWIDWQKPGEKIIVTLKYSPYEWLPKEGLFFVQLEGALCMPIGSNLSPTAQLMLVDTFERMLSLRKQLIEQGMNNYSARSVMSVQRVFHKTRLKYFEVVTSMDLRQKLSIS